MVIGTVIQCSFNRELFHPVCLTLIGYGVLGLYDDMQKIRTKNNYGGLSPTYKFLLQWLLALTIVSMLSLDTQVSFLGYKVILSQSYRFFAAFIMVASSNAYNLTDGLDGLAATQGLILLFGYGVLAIATQHPVINIIVPLWIMLFGFYSVNYYPAKLFMGDVGSLSIGAVLGLLAIILKVEILFAFAASVMVFEVISVVLQVGFYKMGYGRIFKMAPFHHHLELCGWGEIKIVKVASAITMGLLYLCTYAV